MRSNLLRNTNNFESYDGTRYDMDLEVDTRFPPENLQDIDSRFGISTRNVINEQYDSATDLDAAFTDNYQIGSNYKNRVGGPPRGIFDDV